MFFKAAVFTALLSPCLAFSQIGVELPSSPAPVTSGPTLEQTVDWIIKKINAIPPEKIYKGQYYTAVGNGCTIQIDRHYPSGNLNQGTKFNFKDIDPKNITVSTFTYDGVKTTDLQADTLGDAKVIETRTKTVRFMSSFIRMTDMDIDIEYAESMKNSLIHAQKLCAHKASTEKATKPKDLF